MPSRRRSQLITEAVTPASNAEGDTFDKKTKEIMQKNWLVCWRNMTFKDLHDFPLWETQLHDIIKDSFTDLQSIFLCAPTSARLASLRWRPLRASL